MPLTTTKELEWGGVQTQRLSNLETRVGGSMAGVKYRVYGLLHAGLELLLMLLSRAAGSRSRLRTGAGGGGSGHAGGRLRSGAEVGVGGYHDDGGGGSCYSSWVDDSIAGCNCGGGRPAGT
jgi:hypothetical protein